MSEPESFEVRLAVLPVQGLRSPSAETVVAALSDLGFSQVERLSLGKLFIWHTRAPGLKAAEAEALQMAERLLANPVTEEALVLSVTPSEGTAASPPARASEGEREGDPESAPPAAERLR